MKKLKPIPYPTKLAKNLNQRLYRLETRGLIEDSPFYQQSEDLALKGKYYNWTLRNGTPTVRVFTPTQWAQLAPSEQKKLLEMYQGAMQAKTSTASGIKASKRDWLKTYMLHNPKLFEDENEPGLPKREALARAIRNMQKAEQHKQFFQNFWAQMKDHFQYDSDTWSNMMQNYDIDAMIESGMTPNRLLEIYRLIKRKGKKDITPKERKKIDKKIPKKYKRRR